MKKITLFSLITAVFLSGQSFSQDTTKTRQKITPGPRRIEVKKEEEKAEEDATPLEVALSAPALFAPPKTQQGTGGTSQIRFAEEVLVPRPGRSRKGKKTKEKETDSKGKKAKRMKDTYLETEPEAEPVTEPEAEPATEPEMEPVTGAESGEV